MNKARFRLPNLLVIALLALPAAAQMPVPDAPSVPARGYVLVDHQSGHVIAEKLANEPLEPASLTKLMTAYVAFRALSEGTIGLQDPVPVSVKAWRTPGSRMFIKEGTTVPVQDLLRGMIVVSGNDASVALAEHIAGSESAFAELMNHYAGELGMTGTRFLNSTGLPAEGHVTTARDMATLASALIREFPEFYRLYSEREFTWGDITQPNRNNLLWRDASVDGVKTGHTDAAGYCLVTSAARNDMRLVSVVMGSPSPRAREEASQSLLNYGFMFFETHRVYGPGDAVATARVWKGVAEETSVGVRNELWITVPRGRYDALEAEVQIADPLIAPIEPEPAVGELRISLDGQLMLESPLYPLTAVPEGGFVDRVIDSVMLWLE